MTCFKGILFDNDGTLVDTRDLILESMRHCTRTVLGREISDDVLMRKVGQPLAIQMRDFTDDEELQVELLRVYREYNHAVHDDAIAAFPGAQEALVRLSAAGVRMGVVTSKMHWLAWRGLEITGLAPYLDCCIGADDC
ncbi:MAG: HAD hydrolase-like protein, partial [Eggerthellaceae bacterium]|nr:HAD hydrolase-like protein [Eggerthellaceae bacterium]